MELKAPRNLNEPARCKFSHLKHNFAPARESAMRDRNRGVRCASLSSLFVAASISAYVGSRTEGGSMLAVDESVLGMCFSDPELGRRSPQRARRSGSKDTQSVRRRPMKT